MQAEPLLCRGDRLSVRHHIDQVEWRALAGFGHALRHPGQYGLTDLTTQPGHQNPTKPERVTVDRPPISLLVVGRQITDVEPDRVHGAVGGLEFRQKLHRSNEEKMADDVKRLTDVATGR